MATTNSCTRCDVGTATFTSIEFDRCVDGDWGANRTFVTLCDRCISPLMSLIDNYVYRQLGRY